MSQVEVRDGEHEATYTERLHRRVRFSVDCCRSTNPTH